MDGSLPAAVLQLVLLPHELASWSCLAARPENHVLGASVGVFHLLLALPAPRANPSTPQPTALPATHRLHRNQRHQAHPAREAWWLNPHPPPPPPPHPTPLSNRTSTLVDRLEVLSKQVSGACSAVAADGDAEAVAALGRELRKPKVGLGRCLFFVYWRYVPFGW